MAMVTVDARYTADTSAYVRAVSQAQRATQQFADSLPRVDDSMNQVKTSTIALGSALGTIGVQALARAGSAVKNFAMQGIEAAKSYEQTVISIEGIFQGMGMTVEQATSETKTYLADLRDFAAATPFELPQILDAVKRLLSIGYAANEVKDTILPAVGDIVAALGQPPSAVEAVVYAFGQMKSAGRVMSQDLMQVGNALPGFNAKMAIAAELFGGDMRAMSQAMESGTLDAEVAIQAIIKAMQKFPGAAGAMERQSKTLSGVMSTFADTVNNALIDGLMPSMPVLSEALLEVMPAVEALAESFAQALGPMLIEGAELMGDLAPIASALIPPIFDLMDVFRGVGEVIAALSPVLVTLGNALGALMDLFNALPGPVKTLITVMIGLRLLMLKYPQAALAMSTGTTTAFAKMKVAATMAAGTILISFTSIRTGMELIKVGAMTMGTGIVNAFRAAGVAAKAFMASLGPVGWALTAAAVAFEVFSGKSAQAEELVARLRDTVDETTGSFTMLSAAMMGEQFRMDLSTEDQAKLAELGIGVNEAVAAIMAGGPAIDAFREKIAALQGFEWTEEGEQLQQLLAIYTNNFNGMADAAAQTALEVQAAEEAKNHAIYLSAMQTQASMEQSKAARRAEAIEARANADQMTAIGRELSASHESYADAGVRAHSMLDAAFAATVAAVQALQAAYEELESIFSETRAEDRAHDALKAMKEQLDANKDGIDGYKGAAQDNRAAVLDFAEAQVALAKSLENPVEAMEVLKTTQEEVRAALKAQGVDPKDSALYQEISGAVKAAEDEIKNMETAVDNAKEAGTDVSSAISAGITAGMSQEAAAINAAGLVGGEALIDGMNSGAGVSSPSIYAIEAGKNVGYGLMQGMRGTMSGVNSVGQQLGNNLINGMVNALNAGQGSIAAAARAAVEAGIAAAKAAGGIQSPSKEFWKIGEQLMAGLRLGTTKSARAVEREISKQMQKIIAEAQRRVQDARWDFADSKDAIRDAEKQLREVGNMVSEAQKQVDQAKKDLAKVRKDKDADKDAIKDAEKALKEAEKALAQARKDMPHEVAAAERDLAKARRDAADAAAELAQAEKDLQALRKIAKMGVPKQVYREMQTDIFNLEGLSDALDTFEFMLRQRALAAGMSRDAAEDYASTIVGNVKDQAEAQIRLLEQYSDQLQTIMDKINAIVERREEGRQSLIELFTERLFGRGTQWQETMSVANLSIDQAADMFTDLAAIIRDRFAGIKGGMKDALIQEIKFEIGKLIGLIKQRDEVLAQLEVANANLDRAKQARDQITEFLKKPLGEPSELEKALNRSEMTVDNMISFYGRVEDLIRARYTTMVRGADGEMVEQFSATGQALLDTLTAESAKLVALIRKRDDVLKRLEEADKKLEELTRARDEMSRRISDSLAGLFKSDGQVGSVELYKRGLQQRLDATKAFLKNITALRKAGLDVGLVEEILAAGAERGGAMAAALAGATAADIAEINKLRTEGLGLADSFGTAFAESVYGTDIAAQTKIRDGLVKERDGILAEMKTITDGITALVKGLASETGEGSVAAAQAIVDGLRSQLAAITAAMQEIVDGIEDTLAPLTDSMFDIGQGGGINLLAGYQQQARVLLRRMRDVAQAIADMMAEAMGTKAPRIRIPQSVLDLINGETDTTATTRAGARSAVSSSSTSSSAVNVASGGIQVTVNVGAGADPQSVTEAVRAGVDQALARLADATANGRR